MDGAAQALQGSTCGRPRKESLQPKHSLSHVDGWDDVFLGRFFCVAEGIHLVEVQVFVNFASHRIDVLCVLQVFFRSWQATNDSTDSC